MGVQEIVKWKNAGDYKMEEWSKSMKKIICRLGMWTMAGVFFLGGCGQTEDESQDMQSSDKVVFLNSAVVPDKEPAPDSGSNSGSTAPDSGTVSGSAAQDKGMASDNAQISGRGTASGSAPVSGGTAAPNQDDTIALREEKRKAYQAALEKLYTQGAFPDGMEYGASDGAFDQSNNCFAIFDIDFDGEEELIIRYTDTIVAGMIEAIYDYDIASGTFTVELSEFPALTFYDNGMVKAELSHNHGRGGEFWPYSVYKYDQETDAYLKAGSADAWDQKLGGTDGNGNPFPKEIDSNGDGIVYYVMGGKYTDNTIVDLEEYNQWWDSMAGDAEEMEIPCQKLKEYAQRYAVCTSKSVWEVEDFARKVKEQILLGDFQGLSKEIAYPVTIDGVVYQNEEAFLEADFVGNRNQALLAELEAESCEGMFADWEGIMLGNGCVWIGEVMKDDLTSQGLRVIKLNGFASADAAE